MPGVSYIRGNRVLIDEKLIKATLEVEDGKIRKIHRGDYNLSHVDAHKIIDAGDHVLMSGLLDTHTHIDEPGRTDWEGFETATRAAAAGGFTTLIDMPLQCNPPTTTVENFKLKLAAAKGKCYVDVGFWGGALPNNRADMKPLLDMGVWGFKCFLIDTGFKEFPFLKEVDADNALAELEGTGSVLMFHAEVACPESDDDPKEGRESYQTLLEHRPAKMECDAIRLIQRVTNKHKDVRAHIVHLSASDALPIIKEMKDAGIKLSVETCPHYLHFSQDDIEEGCTEFKCLPPIRDAENREKLWKAIGDGLIDLIAADHANCTPDEKPRDFMKAWGGLCGLQFGLSVLWTNAKKHGHSIVDVWRWMSHNPTKLAGLTAEKGEIKEGFNADLVIWDPSEVNEIDASMQEHKNKLSAYNGEKLLGKVKKTILRGRVIYDGKVLTPPEGHFLFRHKTDAGKSHATKGELVQVY
jgi:allantoinase